MPGLLNLPIELRLAIFNDVFNREDQCALTHPLLHVCQTVRLEYIDILSGTFSLSIIGIPGLATHPGLNRQLYQALAPKFSIVRIEKTIPLHPKKKSMDLFAFANSPYAWLIEHACGALIKPTDVSSRRSRYVSADYSPCVLKYVTFLNLDYSKEHLFTTKRHN